MISLAPKGTGWIEIEPGDDGNTIDGMDAQAMVIARLFTRR